MKRSIHKSKTNSKSYIVASIVAIGVMIVGMTADAAGIAAAKTVEPASQPTVIDARVIGITDGDTFTALAPGKEQIKIRIYGIDAPEKTQPYGAKSKQFLSSLIFDRMVAIYPQNKDLYGRTIARVLVDGIDVGKTSVEYGMAWWYCQYAKRDKDLAAAQKKAKNQGLGLWSEQNPIAPWEYRKKVVK